MRTFVVTLVLVALIAAGCGGGEASKDASTVPMATTEPSGEDRQLAPPIEGTSLEGEPVSLADFAGRPVLVNVWSSW